jgi:hypothetical protein
MKVRLPKLVSLHHKRPPSRMLHQISQTLKTQPLNRRAYQNSANLQSRPKALKVEEQLIPERRSQSPHQLQSLRLHPRQSLKLRDSQSPHQTLTQNLKS